MAQDVSPEEVAPLQPPEVAVIAAGLQLHGQSPQRWELIAGSLPGRKPSTLARLWFHHSSGVALGKDAVSQCFGSIFDFHGVRAHCEVLQYFGARLQGCCGSASRSLGLAGRE